MRTQSTAALLLAAVTIIYSFLFISTGLLSALARFHPTTVAYKIPSAAPLCQKGPNNTSNDPLTAASPEKGDENYEVKMLRKRLHSRVSRQEEDERIEQDMDGPSFRLWENMGSGTPCNNYVTRFGRRLPRVYLVSFPLSGNTWTRYLLEAATGVFSGSVYNETTLYNNGFLGEKDSPDSGRTLVQSTHAASIYDKFPHNLMTRYSQLHPDLPTILLLRDPVQAISSYWKHYVSNKTKGIISSEKGSISSEEKGTISNEKKGTVKSEKRGSVSSEKKSPVSSGKNYTTSSKKMGTVSSEKMGTLSSEKNGTISSEKKGTISSEKKGAVLNKKKGTISRKKKASVSDKNHEDARALLVIMLAAEEAFTPGSSTTELDIPAQSLLFLARSLDPAQAKGYNPAPGTH
ncbi:uncharacterized protein LOC121865808 [Homarus americanus]|uniref:uncharacterized protein LOC121865808 n=1 Tax=Homarus americanus TaxID=6706 RepID=UPI001C4767C6|nr:uncharacterized protein LOC121865808 [Homarus americanus]